MIEVLFELGDGIGCHEYPMEFGWQELHAAGGHFVSIQDKDGKFVAHYQAQRIICIRKVA